jgi:hypothetical protein
MLQDGSIEARGTPSGNERLQRPLQMIARAYGGDAMIAETDLNLPARLQYEPAGTAMADAQIDWSNAREYPSLREAIHRVMTEEPPPGRLAYIRCDSGFILRPEMLESLWSSLQGP